MLVFVAQKNRATVIADKKKNVLGMLGGSVLGILGIGCGACGSLILTPLAISIGATGFLAVLPFGGSEFGFLGIALFMFSMYSLSKKINDPLICPVE
ncbi:MAG: hypothetical protein A2919_01050 [Candidatus Spechtbacteria bacterium RIFCSPLOWO2_01_FULL_43_12]|uniref:Uncharacterized protein n=1 Tax=Candidatus Spechtbacteria bacterium RIFCSPLOWO2_01_FULL_43_12 TaxID=1802162 RepID=A0A1G2HFB0_9BACT|nr:MAG: hypothetical protein A2919_01050 [Candidatus Spechtbacteria bacterium RIFCSPLOWO2_01_FULL_43_12]